MGRDGAGGSIPCARGCPGGRAGVTAEGPDVTSPGPPATARAALTPMQPRSSTLPSIPHREFRDVTEALETTRTLCHVSRATWGVREVCLKSCFGPDDGAMASEVHMYGELYLSHHPNIPRVHGICRDPPDGKQRLVMDWCERGTLENLLRTAVPLVSLLGTAHKTQEVAVAPSSGALKSTQGCCALRSSHFQVRSTRSFHTTADRAIDACIDSALPHWRWQQRCGGHHECSGPLRVVSFMQAPGVRLEASYSLQVSLIAPLCCTQGKPPHW
jgi:hypothetical protein